MHLLRVLITRHKSTEILLEPILLAPPLMQELGSLEDIGWDTFLKDISKS